MQSAPAAGLVEKLPSRQTVLVTDATGFIGSRLVAGLTGAGHHVIALVRNPAKAEMLPPPITLITSLDQLPADSHIDAIVNLAGEPIGNGLWTEAKRRKILNSRINMAGDVIRLIARLERKPAVLVSGSAIGWYGLWQDQVLTEYAKSHACFSHELCDAWENAARPAEEYGVRVACLRIGLVLGADGGFITRMLTPFEFGLGGPLGSGRQWMSWIERDDLIRLIAHVIARPEISGPVNATPPIPVTNLKFTEELAAGCTGQQSSASPTRCCAVSAAISPTSFCWAASACCRTRRSATDLCSGTKRCAARSRGFCSADGLALTAMIECLKRASGKRSLQTIEASMSFVTCRAAGGWIAGCGAATAIICATALLTITVTAPVPPGVPSEYLRVGLQGMLVLLPLVFVITCLLVC